MPFLSPNQQRQSTEGTEVILRLNLLNEEKSVSAGSLFHVLITRSQKKVVRIFRLLDFLNNHTSTPPLFFTGRMPFLPPNAQRQSTEGKYLSIYLSVYLSICLSVYLSIYLSIYLGTL